MKFVTHQSPCTVQRSFQASDMRGSRHNLLLIWAQALFSLAPYQCLLPADLQDFSQLLVLKVRFAWILFCSGISRHSWRPLVSGGHAGLVDYCSKPFQSYPGRAFCFPWLGCPCSCGPSLSCCRWSEQLHSTSLLLVELGTRIPKFAMDVWWHLRWFICLRRLPVRSWWIVGVFFFQNLVCSYLLIILSIGCLKFLILFHMYVVTIISCISN